MLPLELFDLLVLTLCRQAPAFAASLNYAKLVMAVLTMYQSQVRPGPCRSAVSRWLGLPRTLDLARGSQVGSWQGRILFLSIPGHSSPPEPSGYRSGLQQRGSKEIAAGCAGRREVRRTWMLCCPRAGVSLVGTAASTLRVCAGEPPRAGKKLCQSAADGGFPFSRFLSFPLPR